MIPYLVAACCVFMISSPTTVVSLLPSSVTEDERITIQTGLEQTQQGIRETGGAFIDVLLRLWLNSDNDKSN